MIVECSYECETVPVARESYDSCWNTRPSCSAQCIAMDFIWDSLGQCPSQTLYNRITVVSDGVTVRQAADGDCHL